MREIKFRCWSTEGNMWMSTYRIGVDSEGNVWDMIAGVHLLRSEYIVQFYTGLKDKNGVEIYEGDIVRYGIGFKGANARNDNGIVIWETEGAYFRIKNIVNESGNSWSAYLNELWCEVIGNIYENKELLK